MPSQQQPAYSPRHSLTRIITIVAVTILLGLQPSLVFCEQRVIAPDQTTGARFGESTDLDGDLMVVGAQFDSQLGSNAGAAYVFRRSDDQWLFEQKLLASDGSQSDEFGIAVAVRRDLIAVGARFAANASAVESGVVYLYQFNGATWEEIDAFEGASSNEQFGTSVDIEIAVPEDSTSGDEVLNVVVGVPRRTGPMRSFDGAVLLYQLSPDKTQWEEIGEFFDDDTLSGGQTGSSVAMKGDVIVAGAPQDEQLGSDAGAVYVFARSGSTNVWNQQDRKQPGDYGMGNERGRWFGSSVAIDAAFGGPTVFVVGASLNANGGGGAAYIYDFLSGLPIEQVIIPPNTIVGDNFGASVAIDMTGGLVAVGAQKHDAAGTDAGSVYLYQRTPGGWIPFDQFEASDTAANDEFGAAVSLFQGRLLVGAPGDDGDTPSNNAVGTAYSFDSAAVFADGFESGNTTAWSASTP